MFSLVLALLVAQTPVPVDGSDARGLVVMVSRSEGLTPIESVTLADRLSRALLEARLPVAMDPGQVLSRLGEQRTPESCQGKPECFAKLGRWIVSCHAKDLAWIPEMNVHFREVVPGTGQIDYATYLRELSLLGVDAPLMLEHLQTAEEYDKGREYIRSVGARIGVAFG